MASPVSSGGAAYGPDVGPSLPGTEALCHSCGGGGPVFEELHQLLAGICDHVKGGEVQSILDRGEDARLMLAVERIGTRAWRLR